MFTTNTLAGNGWCDAGYVAVMPATRPLSEELFWMEHRWSLRRFREVILKDRLQMALNEPIGLFAFLDRLIDTPHISAL